jgi:hypothetical protein
MFSEREPPFWNDGAVPGGIYSEAGASYVVMMEVVRSE